MDYCDVWPFTYEGFQLESTGDVAAYPVQLIYLADCIVSSVLKMPSRAKTIQASMVFPQQVLPTYKVGIGISEMSAICQIADINNALTVATIDFSNPNTTNIFYSKADEATEKPEIAKVLATGLAQIAYCLAPCADAADASDAAKYVNKTLPLLISTLGEYYQSVTKIIPKGLCSSNSFSFSTTTKEIETPRADLWEMVMKEKEKDTTIYPYSVLPLFKEKENKLKRTKQTNASKIDLKGFIGAYAPTESVPKSNYEYFLELQNKNNLQKLKVVPNKESKIISLAIRDCGFRNFFLTGLPGTGKTTTAMLVAAGMNLPYTVFSCHAYTEPADLLGGIVPNFNGANLLTLQEYMDDPITSYFDLTGKNLPPDLEKYEQLELINAAYEESYRKGLETKDGSGSKLNYSLVLSSLMTLCNVPGVVEIQEISDIPDQSVAVALNSFLAEGRITLMGHTYHRNSQNIVIFTTNDVNPVAPSVLDRSSMEFLFTELDGDDMLAKISGQSKLPKELLTKMVHIIIVINDYMRDNRIKFGTCGFRSLQDWAKLVEYGHMNPFYAAMYAVVNKVSMREDQRHYCETMVEDSFDTRADPLYGTKEA